MELGFRPRGALFNETSWCWSRFYLLRTVLGFWGFFILMRVARWFLSPCSSRPAAFSTSSASYPESPAAFTTCADCVDRGCGTAATSPPWSAPANTRTRRAAPMEAPPPPSPRRLHPRPRLRPHRTPPPRLRRWAKKPPRPGIFSPSESRPDSEGPGPCESSKCARRSAGPPHPLDTSPPASFTISERFFFTGVLQRGTPPKTRTLVQPLASHQRTRPRGSGGGTITRLGAGPTSLICWRASRSVGGFDTEGDGPAFNPGWPRVRRNWRSVHGTRAVSAPGLSPPRRRAGKHTVGIEETF